MEKEFSGNTIPSSGWNLSNFGMEIQTNGLNNDNNCFFSPNWENSMDHNHQQSDPFESALSSIVSSPVASGAGENIVLRELIGRLGTICNSGGNNNSTNTSCYSTPLNSPPKQTLLGENQIRGYFPIPPSTHQFPSLGSYSCFGNANVGALNTQFGFTNTESEYPRTDYYSRNSSTSNNKLSASGAGIGSPLVEENGEESSVSEQIPPVGEIGIATANANCNARKRKAIPRGGGGGGKTKEIPSSSSSPDATAAEKDAAKVKKAAGVGGESYANAKKSKSDDDDDEEEEEEDNGKGKAQENGKGKAATTERGNQKQSKEKPIEPLKDYIHVRARRGQATDSHSLAERVRREKISERMKFLQDLVPGCNKVTGKAVMLDEIINYVQSLQRQVEFLSMKLATVNPKMDFNMETLLSKDMFQSRVPHHNSMYHQLETPSSQSQSQSPALSYGGYHQLPLLTNNGISEASFFLNNNTNSSLLRRNPTMDAYGQAAASQVSTFLEDELHSVVQMGFGQNQPQGGFPGNTMGTTQMKIEL